jgi:hypothetical protein
MTKKGNVVIIMKHGQEKVKLDGRGKQAGGNGSILSRQCLHLVPAMVQFFILGLVSYNGRKEPVK